ncbi:unnamed protein product [Moneuplotes crassus]|uniref:Uncharacterized protein n=1 Tax=Euplotes crassus TaxID=5936 RepID=A0AAD2D158_EUPCR|nr:unnamed protein product [Moneuplotes crassus]
MPRFHQDIPVAFSERTNSFTEELIREPEISSNESPEKLMRTSNDTKSMPKSSQEEYKSSVSSAEGEIAPKSTEKDKKHACTSAAKKKKKPFSLKSTDYNLPLHSVMSSTKSKHKKKFVMKKKSKKTGLNEECTFEPKLSKNLLSSPKKAKMASSIEKNWKKKGHIPTKLARELEDLKECSFSPDLSKTQHAYLSPPCGTPRFQNLHSKHKNKIIKLASRSRQKKESELLECTFIPKIQNSYMNETKYQHHCHNEREKAKRGHSVKTNRKKLLEDSVSTLHERLHQEGLTAKRKRQNEVIFKQNLPENCTFKPDRKSELEFRYSEEFKEPHLRLYNNYFEVQEKLSCAKEDRNQNLRAMSETQERSNINVSITNNYINSSVNFSTRGRSVHDVHSKLHESNKFKERDRKSLEARINEEAGIIFRPQINSIQPKSQKHKFSNSLATIKSEQESQGKSHNFKPEISERSKRLANKYRKKKKNIPKPAKNSSKNNQSACSERLFLEYNQLEKNREVLTQKVHKEEARDCTFAPEINDISSIVMERKNADKKARKQTFG